MTDRATLVKALRILAREIDSQDGAANAVCEEAANVIEERRWIPVGERLPEFDVDVLAIGEEDGVFQARLESWGGHYRWRPLILDCHGSGYGGEKPIVTHWMPLPLPPNGREGE